VHRFTSYRWPTQRDYPIAAPHAPGIAAAFRASGFDVAHTHSPFTLGQLGRRWARRAAIPVLNTYHTLYEEYAHYAPFFPSGVARRFLRDLSRTYCNACDVVVAPTEPIRTVLREYGVQRPIHVIPTGLRLRPPVAVDPAFPRGQFGIPPTAPLLLYAGRLAKEKNLELLFSAFQRIAREAPKVWFLIAGGGPVEREAREMAQASGAGERIAFAGFVPPERMPLVYATSDLFLFSSLTDTQGLVLTEAKAAGVPAVAVNSCGPSVVVTDGLDGLLTANDPDDFAAAVLRVLSNPDLHGRMREAALQEAQRFSITATAAAYLNLYEELRAAAKPRSR
jgi:glycosyltransferase involved in cell wall biosynthesis